MRRTSDKSGRILWAVDAFGESGKTLGACASLARSWHRDTNASIVPVHVLSSRQLGLGEEFEFRSMNYLAEQARIRMQALLRPLRIPALESPRVIYCQAWARHRESQAVSEYAQQLGAELILVGTHGLSGLKRAALGSFAESLMLHSRVPVLTANPRIQDVRAPRRILFPSEFGPHSKRTLLRVIELAREHGASLSFLHVLPLIPSVLLLGSSFGYPPVYPKGFAEAVEEQKRFAERTFESWKQLCARQGVRADGRVEDGPMDPSEAILRTARRNRVDLIALESETGRMKTALVGSVSRKVLRGAICPVWAIRPAVAFGRRERAHGYWQLIEESPGRELRRAA